jgi:hypothetical protein
MQNLLWSSERGLQIPLGNAGNGKNKNIQNTRQETPTEKVKWDNP